MWKVCNDIPSSLVYKILTLLFCWFNGKTSSEDLSFSQVEKKSINLSKWKQRNFFYYFIYLFIFKTRQSWAWDFYFNRSTFLVASYWTDVCWTIYVQKKLQAPIAKWYEKLTVVSRIATKAGLVRIRSYTEGSSPYKFQNTRDIKFVFVVNKERMGEFFS